MSNTHQNHQNHHAKNQTLFFIYLGKAVDSTLDPLLKQLTDTHTPYELYSPHKTSYPSTICTLDFLPHCHLVFMPDSKEEALAISHNIPVYAKKSWEIKNIARYGRVVLYQLLDLMAKIFYSKPKKTARCIVVKTDAIGDYVLFRNFLKEIYERYGKFDLVANYACQELIQELDSQYIAKLILVHRSPFLKSPRYYLSFLKRLRSARYDILINPIYSRDIISEQVSKNIYAKEKVASKGDSLAILPALKLYYDSFYTRILDSSPNVMFEFYRNLEFFQNLFSTKLDTPYILELTNPKARIQEYGLPENYATFFIGASSPYRKWPNEHFITLGTYLASLGLEIVICGGKEDKKNGQLITKALEDKKIKAHNLCGKTTLSGLAAIVYNGNHLISNETSCVHIAKAVRHDKVFVVYNGNHFRRFTPYPKSIGGEYHGIYHPIIMANPDAYGVISNFLQLPSKLDIRAITPQSVIESIQQSN